MSFHKKETEKIELLRSLEFRKLHVNWSFLASPIRMSGFYSIKHLNLMEGRTLYSLQLLATTRLCNV